MLFSIRLVPNGVSILMCQRGCLQQFGINTCSVFELDVTIACGCSYVDTAVVISMSA